MSTCWNSIMCQDWVFRYKQEGNGHFSHWFYNRREEDASKPNQKKFRGINQKFSTRVTYWNWQKVQNNQSRSARMTRKASLRKAWSQESSTGEKHSHMENKQKSVLNRENVICKGPVPNKSVACWGDEGAGSLGGCGLRWCWRVARDSAHWIIF